MRGPIRKKYFLWVDLPTWLLKINCKTKFPPRNTNKASTKTYSMPLKNRKFKSRSKLKHHISKIWIRISRKLPWIEKFLAKYPPHLNNLLSWISKIQPKTSNNLLVSNLLQTSSCKAAQHPNHQTYPQMCAWCWSAVTRLECNKRSNDLKKRKCAFYAALISHQANRKRFRANYLSWEIGSRIRIKMEEEWFLCWQIQIILLIPRIKTK